MTELENMAAALQRFGVAVIRVNDPCRDLRDALIDAAVQRDIAIRAGAARIEEPWRRRGKRRATRPK